MPRGVEAQDSQQAGGRCHAPEGSAAGQAGPQRGSKGPHPSYALLTERAQGYISGDYGQAPISVEEGRALCIGRQVYQHPLAASTPTAGEDIPRERPAQQSHPQPLEIARHPLVRSTGLEPVDKGP